MLEFATMNTAPRNRLNPASSRALALDRDRKRRARKARRTAGLVEIRLLATHAQRLRLFALMDRESLAELRSPKKVLASAKSATGLKTITMAAAAVKPKRVRQRPDAAPAQDGSGQKPAAKAPEFTGVQLDLFQS